MTFQTSKVTFRGSYIEVDIPDEIELNSPFKPIEVDLVDPGSLYEDQAFFKELPCMLISGFVFNTKCYQKIFINVTCPNITDTYNYECRNTTNYNITVFGANATNQSIAGNETWTALPICPGYPRMNKTSWTECFVDPELYNITRC